MDQSKPFKSIGFLFSSYKAKSIISVLLIIFLKLNRIGSSGS